MSEVDCRQCGHRHIWTHEATADGEIIEAIEKAIADYHYALDTRQHGGIAAGAVVDIIECLLDMPWKQGEEADRRRKAAASPCQDRGAG